MKIEFKINVYADNDRPLKEVLFSKSVKSKVKWLVLLLIFGFITTITADTVTKPYTFTADSLISATEMNDNFDELYDLVNGNLDTNNIASIDASDIATGTIDTTRLDVGTSPDQVAAGDHSHFISMTEGTTYFATTTDWQDVPGYELNITLEEETLISIEINGSCRVNSGQGYLRYNIDGIGYGNISSGEHLVTSTQFSSMFYKRVITLTAGEHTIKLQARGSAPSGFMLYNDSEAARIRLFIWEL